MSVRVFAPAKINLTLEVGAPRADGMHPLQSAVVFADVGDWVEAAPDAALSLSVDGPFAAALEQGDDNLVLRAAHALRAATGSAPGARLSLTKNLPLASGIGGGSSDAAATLKALNALWGAGLSEDALARIGADLGADVPVCVAARAAWMTGVGEHVTPLQAPTFDALLLNPLQASPTAAVFREFDRRGLGAGFRETPPPDWRTVDAALAAMRAAGNTLETPACALVPAIAEMTALLRSDARVIYAALSGSGATIFALTQSAEAARSLADALQVSHPHWWLQPTRLNA